ncbi:MAG: hypothetical protein GDA50_06210 [Alphaproteobacteria bacterium GM202ARS2]|nr:hypothetical protein [Alphaproteobacteria bacterium GM202ARS2]
MQHTSRVGVTLRKGLSSRMPQPSRAVLTPRKKTDNRKEEALWQGTVESAFAGAQLAGLEVTRASLRRAVKTIRKKHAHPLKVVKP